MDGEKKNQSITKASWKNQEARRDPGRLSGLAREFGWL
jgi:hypothetical protein